MEKRRYILDTDIGGDCDDCGALAMLANYAGSEKIELLGVTHCTSNISGAYTACAILDWYGLGDIPVGQTARTDFLCEPIHERYSKPVMENWLGKRGESFGERRFEDAVTLLRRLLADNRDVTLIFIGPLNDMHELLSSQADEYSPLGGIELVKQSVREVIVMGGNFENREQGEYNIRCDIPAAAYTAENCPVPITYCGFEAGEHVFTGGTLADASEDNPVRQGYWYFFGGNQRKRESWDLVTTYYALEPDDPEWRISEECSVTFRENRTVAEAGVGAKFVRYGDERKLEAILDGLIKE